MTGEQRWAATGVVLVLAALWGAVAVWVMVDAYLHPGDDLTGLYVSMVGLLVLALDTGWLFVGLLTVRRVADGRWAWRPVASVTGLAAVLSALCAGATWSLEDDVATALFGFQTLALVGYAALLWTPTCPVAGPDPPDA